MIYKNFSKTNLCLLVLINRSPIKKKNTGDELDAISNIKDN